MAVWLAGMNLRAASFTASLDRDSLTLGEQATLSLTFEGGQVNKVPLPVVDGLQIVQNGSSQSSTIVNGVVSSSITVLYSVTPQRAGEFTIPGLKADVNGQSLATDPLRLIVTKATAPTADAVNNGSQIAFMKLSLPKDKLYVGETAIARLEIYFRDDVADHGQPQFTGLPTDGFSVGKGTYGNLYRRQVGNRTYTVMPASIAVTASRAGTLTLGPFNANVVVLVSPQNRGDDPMLRFFVQGEQKQLPLTSEAISVQAVPLPAENAPVNFSGAVGDFTMTANVGPTNLAVGDPITLRVQISGRGALETVTPPDASGWNGFKSYPPTIKTETSGPMALDGTKTFEQILTPQNSDVHELPTFSFSFFNPVDGKYHTLTQAAVPLTVRATSATLVPVVAADKNVPAQNQSPQDILPIKNELGTLEAAHPAFIERPMFLALQSVPVLAFLAAFIRRKRVDNLANNPRLRRKLAVEKLMQTGLGDLRKLAAENKPDEFFALLFRLLQEQLGERLDCPASAITENVVEENSLLRSAANSIRDGLRELFQLCNQARYAPVRGASELNSVAARFENVLGELRNLKT